MVTLLPSNLLNCESTYSRFLWFTRLYISTKNQIINLFLFHSNFQWYWTIHTVISPPFHLIKFFLLLNHNSFIQLHFIPFKQSIITTYLPTHFLIIWSKRWTSFWTICFIWWNIQFMTAIFETHSYHFQFSHPILFKGNFAFLNVNIVEF